MPKREKTGLWLVGALGGLATTITVGVRAIASGLTSTAGLLTGRPELDALGLVPIEDLVIGGHDVRRGDLLESAQEISRQNGSIRGEWIPLLRDDLTACMDSIRSGVAIGGGAAIQALDDSGRAPVGPGTAVQQIREDLEEFRTSRQIDRLIVVNVASTEPPTEWTGPYCSRAELEATLERDEPGSLRPGLLYSYAAFQAGAAYLNFTPSSSAICPATEELAREKSLVYFGNDGKTGETLVKSALAPMFKYRNLHVDSWVGYNLLGNRDGEVLAREENKRSKLDTKDAVLSSILGYDLQTQVGIDYVRSLADSKVAWDFIHFRGFLEHQMSMQFTWHGCDSILAAPVVLDLVRLIDEAIRSGDSGPLTHLACFFKSPIHCDEHDLHRQFHMLTDHIEKRLGSIQSSL